MFVRCIEESIEIAGKMNFKGALEFITSNIVAELESIDIQNEIFPSRLRLLKKIIKVLTTYEESIMVQSAHIIIHVVILVIQNSKVCLDYPHLLSFFFGLYEELIDKFMHKSSIAPLIMYSHLILKNLTILQKKGGEFLKL